LGWKIYDEKSGNGKGQGSAKKRAKSVWTTSKDFSGGIGLCRLAQTKLMWKVNLPFRQMVWELMSSISKFPFPNVLSILSIHLFPLLLFWPIFVRFSAFCRRQPPSKKSFLPLILWAGCQFGTLQIPKQELLLSGRANGQCKLLAKGRWPLLKPRCCFHPQKCRIGWLCLPRANRPNNNILPPIPFPHNSIPTPERRISGNGIGAPFLDGRATKVSERKEEGERQRQYSREWGTFLGAETNTSPLGQCELGQGTGNE